MLTRRRGSRRPALDHLHGDLEAPARASLGEVRLRESLPVHPAGQIGDEARGASGSFHDKDHPTKGINCQRRPSWKLDVPPFRGISQE